MVNEGGSAGAPENSMFAGLNDVHSLAWGQIVASISYSHTDAYDVRPGTEKSSANILDARFATRWSLADSGELTVALWGKNLLDDEYHQDRINFSEIDGFNAPYVVWFGDPRTYGIEFTWEF